MKNYINDSSKPLVFLGSSGSMSKLFDICDLEGIKIQGIIDNDYYGNTESLEGIPVIDSFSNIEKYKSSCNFFNAVNWVPASDTVSIRNKEKRNMILNLIKENSLPTISLIHKNACVSPRSQIGRGCFIDTSTIIEPNVVLGDYCNVYALAHIGHDMIIGKNCVFQRRTTVAQESTVEDNCFFSVNVKAIKSKVIWRHGTFIQEGIYIKRGTQENEVVTASSSPRVNSIIR